MLTQITGLKMILTTSMDGRFRLWDLKTNNLVYDCYARQVNPAEYMMSSSDVKPKLGSIVGCDYNPNQKGHIVTWYFSNEIQVWNPQFSLQNPYIGKYTGHISGIVDCRILNASPFSISLDSHGVLRIWDIRTFVTSQVLTLDGLNKNCYLCLLEDDNVLVNSQHPLSITNKESRFKRLQTGGIAAINVEFNEYHKLFVVATRDDVRLYSPKTGKLVDIFVSLIPKPFSIRKYCQGGRERMFYLGDTGGNVLMYNTKNAEKLKSVTDKQRDNELIEKYQVLMGTRSGEDTSQFKDVTAMIYLPDDKIVVVGTINSHIKLYQEIDSEESELIKMFTGGHADSEITALAYCRDNDQLASGSDNGIICVWNLSSNKLENSLYEFQSRVIDLYFIPSKKVLLSVHQDGLIEFWALKQAGTDYNGKCVLRLVGLSPLSSSLSPNSQENNFKVISSAFLESPETIFPKNYVCDYSTVPSNIDKNEKYHTNACEKHLKTLRKDIESIKIFNDFNEKELDLLVGPVDFSSSTNPSLNKQKMPAEKEKKKLCYRDHLYILLGTSTGDFVIADAGAFFAKSSFSNNVSSNEFQGKTSSFYPGFQIDLAFLKKQRARFEIVSVHSTTEAILKHISPKPILMNTYSLFHSLVISLKTGLHEGGLSSIGLMGAEKNYSVMAGDSELASLTLLTGGKDSRVRLWNPQLNPLGEIDLCGKEATEKSWRFKYNYGLEVVEETIDAVRLALYLDHKDGKSQEIEEGETPQDIKYIYQKALDEIHRNIIRVTEEQKLEEIETDVRKKKLDKIQKKEIGKFKTSQDDNSPSKRSTNSPSNQPNSLAKFSNFDTSLGQIHDISDPSSPTIMKKDSPPALFRGKSSKKVITLRALLPKSSPNPDPAFTYIPQKQKNPSNKPLSKVQSFRSNRALNGLGALTSSGQSVQFSKKAEEQTENGVVGLKTESEFSKALNKKFELLDMPGVKPSNILPFKHNKTKNSRFETDLPNKDKKARYSQRRKYDTENRGIGSRLNQSYRSNREFPALTPIESRKKDKIMQNNASNTLTVPHEDSLGYSKTFYKGTPSYRSDRQIYREENPLSERDKDGCRKVYKDYTEEKTDRYEKIERTDRGGRTECSWLQPTISSSHLINSSTPTSKPKPYFIKSKSRVPGRPILTSSTDPVQNFNQFLMKLRDGYQGLLQGKTSAGKLRCSSKVLRSLESSHNVGKTSKTSKTQISILENQKGEETRQEPSLLENRSSIMLKNNIRNKLQKDRYLFK